MSGATLIKKRMSEVNFVINEKRPTVIHLTHNTPWSFVFHDSFLFIRTGFSFIFYKVILEYVTIHNIVVDYLLKKLNYKTHTK